MSKPRSKKFWIFFWSGSAVLLAGFYFFLQFENNPAGVIGAVIDHIPGLADKARYESLANFGTYFFKHNNQEETFLVLFQNNMELRPGGGYLGSFGIIKIKNGHVTLSGTEDLANFDKQVPDGIAPPYPLNEALGIESWKMRDSNWSPDFPANAKKAEEFYRLGGGQENLDGVAAINTGVLASFLKATGPVRLAGYPGTYDSENAILTLEYQVEEGYAQQGIDKGNRKSVMNALAETIMKKVLALNASQKINLAKIILADLDEKDIQLYFADPSLEAAAEKAGWAGVVDRNWNNDYLMAVDANLDSFKSDYYVKRSFDYTVDLSGTAPKADLKITYVHTAKLADWMTRNYLTYLRVYAPQNSVLTGASGLNNVRTGTELGKTYFGALVKVPIGQTRTVELQYALPKNITASDYDLLIQKESGLENIPGKITVIGQNGVKNVYNITLTEDWFLAK
jgi:hypothetical protein